VLAVGIADIGVSADSASWREPINERTTSSASSAQVYKIGSPIVATSDLSTMIILLAMQA